MSFKRILGLFLQEVFLTRRSLEVIMDLFFFSVFSVVVFGYVSVFLAGATNSVVAHYFLLGMLLWEVIRLTQYSVGISTLWNVWSRNLSNMFIAPVSLTEYLSAQMLSSGAKSLLMLVVISLVSLWVFHFNIFVIGWANLIMHYINLTVFGWSTGLVVLGAIFRYGTKIQALAWGLIFLFQPLTAAFFPLSVLPPALQTIAKLFPPTYVFEAARHNLVDSSTDWRSVGLVFGLNVLYLIIALFIFRAFFNHSRQSGQFARNEG